MKKFIILLALLFSGLSKAQVNLNSSLTACYAMAGNANDVINNLNGTLTAVTATADRYNIPNEALFFSGTGTCHLELPDNPLLKPTQALSFSAWIRSDSLPLSTSYILYTNNGNLSDFEAYALITFPTFNGHRFRVVKADQVNLATADSSTPVTLNTWYHVVFTMSNTQSNLYVNGILENTTNYNFGFSYVGGKKVYLGATNESQYYQPFKGAMDNIRFYNRVLNAAEAIQLYTQDPSCLSGGLPPVASFTSSIQQICVGDSIKFTDLSSNNPNSWAWTASGPTYLMSNASNPTFYFNTPGLYNISLVASNGFGSSSPSTQTVAVYPKPNVFISTTASVICMGNSATLNAFGASTYTWSNSLNGPAIVVSPLITTGYTVTGTDSNGCMNTKTLFIIVSECVGLSSEEMKNNISVYPNPGAGFFDLKFKEVKSGELMIYNTLSELIYNLEFYSTENIRLDLTGFANGIYELIIVTSDQTLTKRLIKN